jgi:glutamate dehydrogenase
LHDEIAKHAKNELNVQICRAFLMFNSKLLKTNFWKPSKAALAFSLDASFVEAASYPENPFVIFFVIAQEFQGFHVRFRDISRGGIRVIRSPNAAMFTRNLEGQFSETYNLALTQNLKNKDIPEFGSKGTVLLFKDAQENVQLAFKKYVSGLLDLLVFTPEDRIVDHYQKPELLFLGPDENTADLMEWAAKFAQSRGYKYWKSFTTGKPAVLGGIPHDVHGMTTNGVHAYVVGVLAKLGLQEENVTKFQTGGPDGDLGSNEILISKDKTIAIVDGSGVIYDPQGLNREELRRLARKRVMISEFDASLLTPGGFRVLTTDKDIVLPSGEKVASGMTFRNEFQFHPLSKADLFVPCGGRPAAISLSDVKKVFNGATAKWKVIVEGANLFLTQDARLVLEAAGVVLYKDASANKGGVTSSSLEVLAALSLTDEEHAQHMQVHDKAAPPAFYTAYVADVQKVIIENANLEFECIWREHTRTGTHRCVLTDKISEKINALNDACAKSKLFDNLELRHAVLSQAIPGTLQSVVPINEIIARLPENYSRAIFSAFLAARFVYRFGLSAHDFAFFEFVSSLLEKNMSARSPIERN